MPKDFEMSSEIIAKLDGIIIGKLSELKDGLPFVEFVGSPSSIAILALSIQPLDKLKVGAKVALSFENGDPSRPIILGNILGSPKLETPAVTIDDSPPQPLELTAKRELTLRCGKASITLTKEGKIILRGTYISSRSSGANRIKGGSVHLN